MDIRIDLEELKKVLPEIVELRGDARPVISGISSIEDAGEGDLVYVASPKFFAKLAECKASVVIVPVSCKESPASASSVYIVADDPAYAMAKVCELIESMIRPRPAAGIDKSASVAQSAKIGLGVYIGPHASVGDGAEIGDNCVIEAGARIGRGVVMGERCHLHPNTVVHDLCKLGRNIILQPGAVIGADGFGYIQIGKLPDLSHYKVPQLGVVVLEDNVEMGANATIDRARFGETVVGEGTKIDNLVQVGHNCRIGRRCIICSQVGISGSTNIGDFVVIWGQAGLVGHINVGDGSFIGAQGGVISDLPAGSKVTGTPARPLMMQRRIDALGERLPEIVRTVDKLKAMKAE